MVGASRVTTRRILFDSNILIAVEEGESHAFGSQALEVMERANSLGFERVVSAGTRDDFLRAGNRAAERQQLLRKYFRTMDRAAPRAEVAAQFPYRPSVNDQADIEVLNAYASGYADVLVSEDDKLRRRASRIGLERVFDLGEAWEWLRELSDPQWLDAPDVELASPYSVNASAGLFDSLRDDYPGFDDWWRSSVVPQDRTVICLGPVDDPVGLAVLKPEPDTYGLGPQLLKICTFKVGQEVGGARRGELLLRSVIEYARGKGHDTLYVTVHAKHQHLIDFLEGFGFEAMKHRTDVGEGVFVKYLNPPPDSSAVEPLDHNVRYGPGALICDRLFIVPIQSRYHSRLLPDADGQPSLLPQEPCGNAIRKTYLCRANIKQLRPGDTLLFLRTDKNETATGTAVGVVEDTLRSADPVALAEFSRGRTVYSLNEITALARASEVLAIQFRFDRSLPGGSWSRDELIRQGAMRGSPQSVQEARQEGMAWIRQQLDG